MASLGLDFVYDLMCSTPDGRSKLVRSNSPNSREFLWQAVENSPSWPPGHQHERDPNTEDDISRNNYGYHFFATPGETSMVYRGISPEGNGYSPLRGLGYVFWNSSRIKEPQVFEKLQAAKAMTWDEIHERFDRRYKETVEDRFKGAMLPRSELKTLEDQFGWIARPMEDYEEEPGLIAS